MELNFCKVCDNMLYMYDNPETNQLYWGCKTCGNTQENSQSCIYNNNLSVDLSETISRNPHLKDDVTLPVIKDNPNLTCPNKDCNKGGKPDEITYLKYDKKNMKFLYLCKFCQQTWTNQQN